MRKSVSIKRGRYFASAGWGRYGPYGVATYRKGRIVGKFTTGTKGTTVGGRVRIWKKVRVGVTYNLTHHRRSVEARVAKKRFYFPA
jgi:hypothetical protein